MEIIETLLSFIVLIVVLVTVHEWGHFIVARSCGVKVLRFSVGFGKPFWSWYDKKGTEFALAPFPLGGYVKMANESDESLNPEDREHTFESRTVGQKVAILLAGPFANFALALLLLWWLAAQSIVVPAPVIGAVEPGSVAFNAGVAEGQKILAVDGVKTPTEADVYARLSHRLGETGTIQLTVTYQDDSDLTYDMSLVIEEWLRGQEIPDPLEGLGLSFYRPDILMTLGGVVSGSPASEAGLQAGDTILETNGEIYTDWAEWTAYIRKHPGNPLQLIYERDGVESETTITPESQRDESGALVGRVGVYPTQAPWPEDILISRELGVAQALLKGAQDTWSNSVMVLVSVKKFLFGEISHKNLSGPVGIAKVAGDSARRGMMQFIGIMALVSISLGIFNLLPVPMLDGGQIIFCVAEALKGSPVSEKIRLASNQVGLVLLGSLMVVALYNDVLRL